MPVEMLVHAVGHAKAVKGAIQDIRDVADLVNWPWGGREGLPDYVIVRVNGTTLAQVNQYRRQWRKKFTYELMAQNASGRRYRISINARVLAHLGEVKGFKAAMREFLVGKYNAQVVSYTPSAGEVVLDIPNTDWAGLAAEFNERFESLVAGRQYRFPVADVDAAISAGGRVSISRSTAIDRIVDLDA